MAPHEMHDDSTGSTTHDRSRVKLRDLVQRVQQAKPGTSEKHAHDWVTGFAALDHDVPVDYEAAMEFTVSREGAELVMNYILNPAEYPH